MKQQRKPTFDEWMHFLRETKKLREKQQTTMKTPMYLVIPTEKPVAESKPDDCGC